MKLIKSYTVPTTLYLLNTIGDWEKEDEEFCVKDTDDYSGASIVSNKGVDESFVTDGGVSGLNTEQFNTLTIENLYGEEVVVFKFENFVGDVYVRMIGNDNKDYLDPNADLDEYLAYQTTLPDEEDGDISMYCSMTVVLSGSYSNYTKFQLELDEE